MTMLVDRRKDNYDELLVLARDARASRARVNRWTTGLVFGSMVAGGAYVAAVSQEVDQLRTNTEEAEQQRDVIQTEYERLAYERNVLRDRLEILVRHEDMYADIAPALILGKSIEELDLKVGDPSSNGNGEHTDTTELRVSLSNLVWLVDGSRRFPLTAGDILWVPKGERWIRMEAPEGNVIKPSAVTIHEGKKPVESADEGTAVDFNEDDVYQNDVYQIKLGEAVESGVANCIELTYHPESRRFGFTNPEYVDIEVLFYNHPECPERLPTPPAEEASVQPDDV